MVDLVPNKTDTLAFILLGNYVISTSNALLYIIEGIMSFQGGGVVISVRHVSADVKKVVR